MVKVYNYWNMRSLLPLIAMLFCWLAGPLLGAYPTVPILFVTQVPMPDEINSNQDSLCKTSCVTPIQNPLGDTASAGRGGALMIYYPATTNPGTTQGIVVNLTARAGYGVVNNATSGISTGLQAGANAIAVQHPMMDWTGTKAIFSMVVGAPSSLSDTSTFYWQLYEITNFDRTNVQNGTGPTITKVPNQPANYNNLHACYGTNGRIIFTSDRTRNGAAHLYPQRDEYLLLPTNTGIWSMDPTQSAPGNLVMLAHMPSGAFSPFIDSFGRLLFVQWDHLTRDRSPVTDRVPNTAIGESWVQTTNGMGNWDSEAVNSTFTMGTNDTYPEPRNFDKTGLLATNLNGHNVNGNAFNFFFLWQMNEDGSNHEFINHMGRHELHQSGTGVLPTGVDTNIVGFDATAAPARTYLADMLSVVESPITPGLFYGVDGPDLGSHGAGQIFSLTGAPGLNPDQATTPHMTLSYVAPTSTAVPKPNNFNTVYRTPCPLSDGTMVASHASATALDSNIGTATAPLSRFDFRLKTLKAGNVSLGEGLILDQALTSGIQGSNLSWYSNGATITYNGPLWELDAVEVRGRTMPATQSTPIDPIEQQVFVEEGVDAPTMQNYLRTRNLALVISRDVTHRDKADKQQPYNLRIAGTSHQTVANAGQLYDIGWLQIFQADSLRGLTNGTGTPVPGRRILPAPLSTLSEMPAKTGAPAGAVKLGTDGSFAAVVPARKGVTWHLTNGDGSQSIVKERFWVNFAPGEVRTCANCHGINTTDQSGATKPTNKPNALRELLQFWKANNPPGAMQHATASSTVRKNSGTVTLQVKRVGGNTGPVSVNYTLSGTAVSGVDYTAPVSNTLTWIDGDTADKVITLPLLNPSAIGPNKTVIVNLSNPLNGSVGAVPSTTLTISEPPFQGWQFSQFAAKANNPSVADDNADPDHDGMVNLLEYALGGDPNQPSPAPMPVISHINISGTDYLTLTYTKDVTKTDVVYQAQASMNLGTGSWTDISDDLMGTSGNIETHRAKIAVGGGGFKFLRLQVTRP